MLLTVGNIQLRRLARRAHRGQLGPNAVLDWDSE